MGAPEGRGITVLFATHNGEQTLPRMIRALRRLKPPARPWRIIVVDNASTDSTPWMLAEAACELPLSIVPCPRPGKMAALRAGAAHVHGDLVVFTDDDVEPCPEWLGAYEAAADAHPEAGLFGGPITPAPLAPLGPWFDVSAAHHVELFGKCELVDGSLDPRGALYGPNFMLRARHLDVLSTVPEQLGPRFNNRLYPMGQDDQIMIAANERGVAARGVAEARVNHLVRPHQTDLRFMLDRAVRHGRGCALRKLRAEQTALSGRLWLAASSLPAALLPVDAEKAEPDARLFERLWNVHWRRGVVLGATFGPFAP